MSSIIYTYVTLTLLSLLVISLITHIIIYLFPYSYIIRSNKKIKHNTITNNNYNQPPVSIIICARNEGDNIANFLPLVLEQNYPQYQVIIVNDGSLDYTTDIIEKLQSKYNNLYLTHIPTDARIISHKKLAITVGIKAAKYEHLLFIDADCRPLSADWISNMMNKFDNNTEFVIGIGNYYHYNNFLSTIINYDTLLIAIQYMGYASIGTPYMGVGRNMAYLKSTFLKNKGFAGLLHIASGDDDLLINNFANKSNIALATSIESTTLSIPKINFKDWYLQKLRHISTSKYYNHKSKLLIALEPMMKSIFYLSIIGLSILNYTNFTILIALLTAIIIKFTTQYIIINKTAKIFKQKRFGISLIILDIFLPIFSLYLLIIKSIFHRNHTINWK